MSNQDPLDPMDSQSTIAQLAQFSSLEQMQNLNVQFESARRSDSILQSLALSGQVRRVRGVLPLAMQARREARRMLLVPAENAEEAAVVEGLDVYPVGTLREAADFLAGGLSRTPFEVEVESEYDFVPYPIWVPCARVSSTVHRA